LDRHIFFSPAVANSVAVDIEKLGTSVGRLAACHPFGAMARSSRLPRPVKNPVEGTLSEAVVARVCLIVLFGVSGSVRRVVAFGPERTARRL
jgi:hypothetical protein